MDGVVSSSTHPRAASLLAGQDKSHQLTPTLETLGQRARLNWRSLVCRNIPLAPAPPFKGAVAHPVSPPVKYFTSASPLHHHCIRSTSLQHHQFRFSIYKCKPSVLLKNTASKRVHLYMEQSFTTGIALALLWRSGGNPLTVIQSVTGSASACL